MTDADQDESPDGHRKRPRSASYDSSTSVTTISTNLSRSASPKRPKLNESRPSYGSVGSRKRRRSSSFSDASYSSDDTSARRRKSWAEDNDRNTRRRRSSISPDNRGRDRDFDERRRLPRSRSNSMDQSRIARHRNSMTPDLRTDHERSNGRPHARPRHSFGADRPKSSYNDARYGKNGQSDPIQPQRVPSRKERSLSPFSKRLALTQAMNTGR